MRKDGLDFVVDKLIFDERSDEARFAGAFITADADAHCARKVSHLSKVVMAIDSCWIEELAVELELS